MISIFIMSTSFAGTGCRKGATKYSCESTKGAKREYLCSKNPKLEKEKITKRCLVTFLSLHANALYSAQ